MLPQPLEDETGLSNAELARRAFVTAQTMNAIVANLEERGLIERDPHESHGRILETHLTRRGRSLVGQAHDRIRAIEAHMAGVLSLRDRRQLMGMLRCLTDALERERQLAHEPRNKRSRQLA